MSLLKKIFGNSVKRTPQRPSRLTSRRLGMECLETRELLSVTLGDIPDYTDLRSRYADLDLSANQSDYNVIEINGSDLTTQGLQNAITLAGTTQKDDIIVLRATSLQREISLTNTITVDTNQATLGTNMGKVFIVGLGSADYTDFKQFAINAHQRRAFNIKSADVSLVGLSITNGQVSTDTTTKSVAGNGGAIANISGNVTLAYSNVSNSSVTGKLSCGGAIYSENGTLRVLNSTIADNKAIVTNGYGGGVYISGSVVTFTNSTISGNESYYGGGIATVKGANVTLIGTTVSGNKTNDTTVNSDVGGKSGGGIYSKESYLSILNNSSVLANKARVQGGGVYYTQGKAPLLIQNSTLSDNFATADSSTGEGGAIYTDVFISITNGMFENNRANRGGAIAIYDSAVITLNIADSKFLGNEATDRGGAIENPNAKSTLNITNTIFDGNFATKDDGGAIYNTAAATIIDSVFSNNSAEIGGAIYTTGKTKISGLSSQFSNNNARKGSGGAIYSNCTSALSSTYNGNVDEDAKIKNITIIDVTITNNRAETTGGGIYAGNLTKIIGCTITDNTAQTAAGGGIYVKADSEISSCFIAGNKSGNEGGGINVSSTKTKIYNSVIAGNSAVKGGGVCGTPLEVINSTIVGNTSTKGGGGLFYSSSTAVTMKNSIVAKNIALGTEGGKDINVAYTKKLTVANSLIGNTATGSTRTFIDFGGNKLGENPNFVAYTDYPSWTKDRWKSWNLLPNSNSAAINNGNNSYVPAGITNDVRGEGYARLITKVDMGAYEYGNTLTIAAPTANSPLIEEANTASSWNVTLTWNDVSGARSYQIYRATENGELIGPPLGTTSKANRTWTDTNLPKGTYYYAIVGVNGSDKSGFNIVTVNISDKDPPGTVTSAVVGNTVILTWDAVVDATHYVIERTDPFGGKTQIDNVMGTTRPESGLSPGTYNYTVYWVDENNSQNFLGTTKAKIDPPMPTAPEISVTPDDNGFVTINWTAVSNADGYEISRKLISGGTWESVHDNRLTGTSYIDYLAPEGYVAYTVTAINEVGSAVSDPIIVFVDKIPTAPDLTATLLDNGRVSLSWNTVAGAESYKIFCKTSGSPNLQVIMEQWESTNFIDLNPPEGNVTYMVSAIEGNNPSKSGTAFVFIEPQEVTVGKPVIIATVLPNQTVSLSWEDAENATEYTVYRRTVASPSWLELTTISGTGFVDTNPPLGTVDYSVTAKRGLSTTKSDTVNATVTLASPTVDVSTEVPNEVSLSWNEVANATYYSVWIKVGTAAWSRLFNDNSFIATEYTHTNPPSGSIKYAVKAHNGTSASTMTPATVNIPEILNAPVINVIQNNGTVSVTWNSVANATEYTVYRREAGTSGWTQVNATTLTTAGFTDTNVPFGNWEYCVAASNASSMPVDSNIAQVSVTLDAPTTVQASVGSSGVTVTWNAVSQATYYSVWIKVGDADWTKIVAKEYSTSFVDTNPQAGSVKYGIKAHNGSNASARKNVTVTIPLSAPSALSASLQGDGTVDLTWSAVTSATHYSVLIKNSSGAWVSLADNVTSTSFTDTAPPSGSVEYAVKAHKGTLTSDLVSDSVNVPLPLSSPVIVTAQQSDGTVLVTWDAVDNATDYVVNRRVAGTATWTQVGTVTATSFVDTTVPLGDFEYSVTAANSSNSVESNVDDITVTLNPPVVTADTTSPGEVIVTWNAVNNATRYSVWVKVAGGAWTSLSSNATGGSFVHTNPAVGTAQYAVKAHNGTIVSGFIAVTVNVSDMNSAATTLPPFGAPVVNAVIQGDGAVSITWGEVQEATRYSVWYQAAGGTWTLLSSNAADGSFVHTNPPIGTVKYTVKAHNGSIVSAFVAVTLSIPDPLAP